ncbi:MAG: hypothetical protein LBF41_05675 [Deltaproteobacteria bacterium]|jgi:hypothetical protein|nr:hypothetical protein [Deltaproteobacteria bacterium]
MKSIFEMLEHDVLELVIIAGTRSVDAKDTEGLGESLLAIGAGLLTRRGKNPGERKFPFVSKSRGASVYRTRKDGSALFREFVSNGHGPGGRVGFVGTFAIGTEKLRRQ